LGAEDDIPDEQGLVDVPSIRLAEIGEFAGAKLGDVGVFRFHGEICGN
jgi:hypothetical protein